MRNCLDKLTSLSLFSFHVQIQDLFMTAEICRGQGRAMAPQALPAQSPALWPTSAANHEENLWEMAQGQITSQKPTDRFWRRLTRAGPQWDVWEEESPLLTRAEVSTAKMLIQSAKMQARGAQHASSPTHRCRHQSTLRSKRKQPLPQQIQRITHLSRNGTSICKRRRTNVRFALNLTNARESTN